MGQKRFTFGLFMGVLFIFSGCATPKFDGSNASLRGALLRGEINEALTYYETEAQEAEKNAAWGEAVNAYMQAADAARFAGQLQRAITYGEKALEITHGTNAPVFGRANLRTLQPPPLPEIKAINSLIQSFASVRDFDKVRVLAESGLTLFRENPSGERITRMEVESRLYEVLGHDLLRRGDYQKAIKTFEQVVILRRAHFANRSKLRTSPRLAENSEASLTRGLIDLALAYRLAGRFDNALEQYQEALLHARVGGTRAIHEQDIYAGLGEFSTRSSFLWRLKIFRRPFPLLRNNNIRT